MIPGPAQQDDDAFYQGWLGKQPNADEYELYWRRMETGRKLRPGQWESFDSEIPRSYRNYLPAIQGCANVG